MTNETKNVLSLESKDAMDFFLKSEQYHGFELPEYFVFDELLQNVKNAIGDIPYEECIHDETSPENLSDVNLDYSIKTGAMQFVRLSWLILFYTIFLLERYATSSLGL